MGTGEIARIQPGTTALARREQKVNGVLMTGALAAPFALMLPALDLCFRGPLSPARMAAGSALWEVGLLVTGGCAAALVAEHRTSWRHKVLPSFLAMIPGLALVLPHPQGALGAAAAAAALALGLLPTRRSREG
jgi:hypothetical protein